jgi:hypothetical protein
LAGVCLEMGMSLRAVLMRWFFIDMQDP